MQPISQPPECNVQPDRPDRRICPSCLIQPATADGWPCKPCQAEIEAGLATIAYNGRFDRRDAA
jgi:hypothetical protein